MIVRHPHIYIWEVWDWRQQNCLKQQSTFLGRQWDGSGGWRPDGRWITLPPPRGSVVWEEKRPDMEVWETSSLRGRGSHGKRCRPSTPTRSSCRGRGWRKETGEEPRNVSRQKRETSEWWKGSRKTSREWTLHKLATGGGHCLYLCPCAWSNGAPVWLVWSSYLTCMGLWWLIYKRGMRTKTSFRTVLRITKKILSVLMMFLPSTHPNLILRAHVTICYLSCPLSLSLQIPLCLDLLWKPYSDASIIGGHCTDSLILYTPTLLQKHNPSHPEPQSSLWPDLYSLEVKETKEAKVSFEINMSDSKCRY